jgi:hypothetical protein
MRKLAVVVISACLVAIGGWVYAQQLQLPQVQLRPFPNLPTPTEGNVLTGPDIGVRIEGSTDGRVVGTVVVRAKDGSWVPVQLGRAGLHRLDTN